MTFVRRLCAFIAALMGTAVMAYALLVCVIAAMQDRMIYPAAGGARVGARAGWTQVALDTADGRLVAYHRPAAVGMPTVVFMHGNASGYRDSVVATAPLVDRGIGVLVPEYPGFGGNPGRAGEASLARTAEAAMAWLEANGVPSSRIGVYGNSLGTGPAVHAALRPHGALVLVSPLSSLERLVGDRFPMAPAAMLRDAYDNASIVARVQGPVTVVHALDDEVVPHVHGQVMADAARVPLVTLATGGHGIAFDPRVGAMVAAAFLKSMPPLH
jgi:pimeloyl-ACP methyl ester carboxylesterase